jgi:hypothetical protein
MALFFLPKSEKLRAREASFFSGRSEPCKMLCLFFLVKVSHTHPYQAQTNPKD